MLRINSFKVALFAVAALALAACGAPSADETAQSTQEDATANVQVTPENLIASGTFSGRSDHVTTGAVSLVKTEAGYQLVFADDFSLDGAPAPRVGFGNEGAYDADSQIAALKSKTGAQAYALPADFSPDAYGEVYVWCEQFSVPLGVATLTKPN